MSHRGLVEYLLFILSIFWVKGIATQNLIFPDNFKFGAATAAYQIEGGWNASDKAPSIWDEYSHRSPSPIDEGATGDVACDSYHLWRRDAQMANELGLHFYRFSISWSRLIPDPRSGKISRDGWMYYNSLIDALLENNIEPMVTLYHWDLPQPLQEIGGWLNSTITEHFAEYARTAFVLYGDRVKTWFTLNEPIFFCSTGYNTGIMAPGLARKNGEYDCAKNALIAHAKAWRLYDKEFRIKYNGRVSLANHLVWYEPQNEGDEEITLLAQQHTIGIYSHPIYSKQGGWPKELEMALKPNITGETLPEFTEDERKLVRGTFDFYAMNYYTTRLVRPMQPGDNVLDSAYTGHGNIKTVYEIDPSWNKTNVVWFTERPESFETNEMYVLQFASLMTTKPFIELRQCSDWTCLAITGGVPLSGFLSAPLMKLNPPSIRKQLSWLKQTYGDLEVLITENGYPTVTGIDDEDRIWAIESILEEVLKAINEDGVNVTGYTLWSLMDNMEWTSGYSKRFGLFEVNFEDENRTRTLRKSGQYYKQLIQEQPSFKKMRSRATDVMSQEKLLASLMLLFLIFTI